MKPNHIVLTDLPNDVAGPAHYRLQRPVVLEVTVIEELVIVSDATWNQFGTGETLEEATAEYASMLVDFFEELSKCEASLAPRLQEQLEELRRLLREATPIPDPSLVQGKGGKPEAEEGC